MARAAELLSSKEKPTTDEQVHSFKCETGAQIGREMELRVEKVLQQARTEEGQPVFYTVIRHEPYSEEDHKGHDFTVEMLVKGDPQKISFGITISQDRLKKCKKRCKCPILWLRPWHNDRQIIEKVIELFRPELRVQRTLRGAFYKEGLWAGEKIFTEVILVPQKNASNSDLHFVARRKVAGARILERSFIVTTCQRRYVKRRAKGELSILLFKPSQSSLEIIESVMWLFLNLTQEVSP